MARSRLWRPALASLVGVTAAVGLSLSACQSNAASSAWQVAERDEFKRTAEAQTIARQKVQRISDELEHLGADHPWAGTYYQGDGLGVNISLGLAPQGGFVFMWHGCMGLYDLNYGPVAEKDGEVLLQCELQNVRKGFQGIDTEMVPVSWGSRKYLIPAAEMVDFCNAINSGDEPRDQAHGRFLLRRDDYGKKVSGMPDLPARYGQYLLSKPIFAAVTAVHGSRCQPSPASWKFRITPVTLNLGRVEGVRVGMEFNLVQPDNVVSAKVVEVAEYSCRAEFMQTDEKSEPKPAVGWQMCTRRRWADHRDQVDVAAEGPATGSQSRETVNVRKTAN